MTKLLVYSPSEFGLLARRELEAAVMELCSEVVRTLGLSSGLLKEKVDGETVHTPSTVPHTHTYSEHWVFLVC